MTARLDETRRILVVDDNPEIHDDFRRILTPDKSMTAMVDPDKSILFDGEFTLVGKHDRLELDYATNGEEAIEKVLEAEEEGRPYCVAFVDVHMPPGMDGVETTAQIWRISPYMQVVLCTAHLDYSFAQSMRQLPRSDQLLILKKPFDPIQVRQLLHGLTKRWSSGRKLDAKLENLERIVFNRTEELRAAYRMASVSASENAEFLAQLSREIRAPLGAIVDFAQALRDNGDITLAPPDRIKSIDNILRNGKCLLGIANDMLDLSQIELGYLELNVTPCRLDDLIDEIHETMEARAGARGIRLTTTITAPLPETIQADEARLQHVIGNLVAGAIDFTRKGYVRLFVSGDDDKLKFRVVMGDTGGDDQELRRTFEVFARPDGDVRREGEVGLDLGLEVGRQLTEVLGGELSADYRPDSGSEFNLILPVMASPGVRESAVSRGPTPDESRLATSGA